MPGKHTRKKLNRGGEEGTPLYLTVVGVIVYVITDGFTPDDGVHSTNGGHLGSGGWGHLGKASALVALARVGTARSNLPR